MRTTKLFFAVLFSTILVLLLSACGALGTPDAAATFNPMVTAAAQTMEALLTQAANQGSQPTATQGGVLQLPTNTLAPSATGFVIPTASPLPIKSPTPTVVTRCDWVSFISDVSVTDGTVYAPATAFVKTWRLKNIGTCTWTSAYSLVFVSGNQMGGPAAVALPASVAPGQTIDLSVTFTSPATEGTYAGYWMLRNPSSVNFGFGAAATTSFWVSIKVANPAVTAIVYDFAANPCVGTWTSGAGVLPCQGTTSDTNGFVVKLNTPQLENNTTGTDAAILAHPQNVNDGYITGTFPDFVVENGDHFKATVGCQYASTVCFVRFRLDYQVGADPVKNLKQWDEKYDNAFYAMDVDLSSLAGKTAKFILTVQSLGSPTQDDALWSAPRITRTTPVSSSGSCQLVSQTPVNNTKFAPGVDFDTTWTIKNTSTFDWIKSDVDWKYISGTKLHKYADLVDMPLDVVKNGTIAMTLDMIAPAVNGTYSDTWAVMKGSATLCTMSVTVKVAP